MNHPNIPLTHARRLPKRIAILLVLATLPFPTGNSQGATRVSRTTLTPQIADTRTSIFCPTDGTVRIAPVGMESMAGSFCPAVKECEDQKSNPNPGCIRNPILLDPTIPHILSPRNTALLTTQPHLRWSVFPNASRYTVTLENDNAEVIWGPVEVQGTEITYSGDVPLVPEPTYILTVTTDTGDIATSTFSLLDDTQRQKVLELLAMQPQETATVIPPQVYIYTQNRLFADAIETLETEIAQGNRSAAIYLELGQLYLGIDLPFNAEQAYLESLELAIAEKNLNGQALAHVRLGQLYHKTGNLEASIDQFSQAKMLYEQAGEPDLAAEVEELMNR
jgi:hypothetical protein